jgi:hypothetical protein
MKRIALLASLIAFPAIRADSSASSMSILRKGPHPLSVGRADPLHGPRARRVAVERGDPARVAGGSTAFEPAARSAWYTHPLDQQAGKNVEWLRK